MQLFGRLGHQSARIFYLDDGTRSWASSTHPNFKVGYEASLPALTCSAQCHRTTNRAPQQQVLSMPPGHLCQAYPGQ